jgi:hypothetical protein
VGFIIAKIKDNLITLRCELHHIRSEMDLTGVVNKGKKFGQMANWDFLWLIRPSPTGQVNMFLAKFGDYAIITPSNSDANSLGKVASPQSRIYHSLCLERRARSPSLDFKHPIVDSRALVPFSMPKSLCPHLTNRTHITPTELCPQIFRPTKSSYL